MRRHVRLAKAAFDSAFGHGLATSCVVSRDFNHKNIAGPPFPARIDQHRS